MFQPDRPAPGIQVAVMAVMKESAAHCGAVLLFLCIAADSPNNFTLIILHQTLVQTAQDHEYLDIRIPGSVRYETTFIRSQNHTALSIQAMKYIRGLTWNARKSKTTFANCLKIHVKLI
jgi:hypothetical protein